MILDAYEGASLLDSADAHEFHDSHFRMPSLLNDSPVSNTISLMSNSLQQYRLWDPPFPVSDEIGY